LVTYYYVVSAVNASGEGPNSTEASVLIPPSVTVTTNVFNDTFSSSTLNSVSPASPGGTSTSYELISSKPWSSALSIAARDLRFGIAATGSGSIQAQAQFSSSPVTLAAVGDTLFVTVTFTNTSGLLTQAGTFGLGLYRSGTNSPVAS